MDIDLSDSDMSRLTTMLTRVGAVFNRFYGASAKRGIEIGKVVFWFNDEGELLEVEEVAEETD